MFQRLRIRITLLAVLLLIVLYSISSFAIYAMVERNTMHRIDADLQAAQIAISNDVGAAQTLYQAGIFVIISDGRNNVPMQYQQALQHSIDATKNHPYYFDVIKKKQHFRVYYSPLGPAANGQTHPFIATIEEDTHEWDVLYRMRHTIILVGLFGLIGATLVGFILAERMLRPIRSAWKRQLEFVADASHELRTPLAVIQSNLGIVMEHTDESVLENLEWLNNAHGESRRLSKLVQDLLTLARSDSQKMPVEQDSVDLQALVMRVQELYETVAAMKEVTLTAHAPEPIHIIGDGDRLHQLLVILLDNAVKFTEAEGRIDITLSRARHAAIISVVDTGLGIAKEHVGRVFDRFFTVDPARSREHTQKGTGLGLSIAHWIVEAHGGKISIESKGLGHGTTVRVELPLSQKSAKETRKPNA